MTTALVSHSACLDHAPPPGHPESAERLRAVLRGLEDGEFRALRREESPAATREQLTRVHSSVYVESIFDRLPERGFAALDPDTMLSPGSGEAALRAAGAVVRGVDLVLSGEVRNAFCVVRPPGHHAEPAQAMGFCLFNNVAVAALHARSVYGLKRIAVADFDVHHGNGTQTMFENDPGLFYASTHQSPLYPGTGAAGEHGVAGNILNLPLAPDAGGPEFRRAFGESLIPAVAHFRPELILVSAGFDAHHDDPLAQLRLADEDFGWATAALCVLAERVCRGRVVSALEGGYDLGALARSVRAHVRALMSA